MSSNHFFEFLSYHFLVIWPFGMNYQNIIMAQILELFFFQITMFWFYVCNDIVLMHEVSNGMIKEKEEACFMDTTPQETIDYWKE